jgi:hypothetical protein
MHRGPWQYRVLGICMVAGPAGLRRSFTALSPVPAAALTRSVACSNLLLAIDCHAALLHVHLISAAQHPSSNMLSQGPKRGAHSGWNGAESCSNPSAAPALCGRLGRPAALQPAGRASLLLQSPVSSNTPLAQEVPGRCLGGEMNLHRGVWT